MIRYSVLYPAAEGATFDHDYYRDSHVPLAVSVFKPLDFVIDTGVDGPYVAIVHMTFPDQAAFDAAMASPDAPAVRADIANYTTIRPVRQISEFSR